VKQASIDDLDRRGRRRRQTIDEILDVAHELMAEQGVAALSLSAVARRMGMQPPSLYQYFPSKMAIYDAMFGRGAQAVLEVRRAATARKAKADPLTQMRTGATAMCRWAMANPVYSQLLFWRTVPGFEPSTEAFAPAVETVAELRTLLQAAVDAGQLDPAAASDDGVALSTSLVAGLLSQQLANEPDATFDRGRFTRLLPTVLDLFVEHYRPGRNS
jgi:AcrR family transcriptional regulator